MCAGLVDRTFPVKAERSGRAIGGLSMGGYGSVKLGLKHSETFDSVNLESLKIPHEYQEFPGGHDWAYRDLHVREAIAFPTRNLQMKPTAH